MLIIAYEPSAAFMQNGLLAEVQADTRLVVWRALLERVFSEPRVRQAMSRDLARPKTQARWNGRPALALVPTGCFAVTRRLMSWSYRTLRTEVNVSVGWRWVCGLYDQPLPCFQTLRDREALLSSATMRLLIRTTAKLGRELGVTEAKRLRLDSTVTEMNIHYPTDSRLLDDAARVLSRGLKRAKKVVRPRRAQRPVFRNRSRQAHRLARQIAQQARRKGKNAGKISPKLYRQLLAIVSTLVSQAAQVGQWLKQRTTALAQKIAQQLAYFSDLAQRVIAQTERRVFQDETVPAQDKLVSLFEPHTAIIRRGKAGPKDTEFGHRVWLAEVEGGLLTEYVLRDGNPPDADRVVPSVRQHRRLFGRMPLEVSGDRGTYSPENEQLLRQLGVKRISLPQPGHTDRQRQHHQRQPWFKAAQRFRAGIEGRISQLRRARRLDRCLNHGKSGLQRWVGWGLIANNLAQMALWVTQRKCRLAQLLT
jgi:transposase, IS5 family